MSDPACAAPEEQSFGEALGELDQIVALLEGGRLELEESIDRYERGVGLLKALQTKLADAQQKVTMLIGELEEEAGPPAGEPPATGTTEPNSAVPESHDVPF